MEIELGKIKIDEEYRIRPIKSQVVNSYMQKMEIGCEFPPLLIDQNNVLIDGHLRYASYCKLYQMDYKVSVIQKMFSSLKDRLLAAAEENSKNGHRMESYEEKKLYVRLKHLAVTDIMISKALGVTVNQIHRMENGLIKIVGKSSLLNKSEPVDDFRPIKRCVSLPIKEMTEKQWDIMDKKASGWSPSFHANQIVLHIKEGYVDLTNEDTISSLKRLKNTLNELKELK